MFNATDKERRNCLVIAPIPLFSSYLAKFDTFYFKIFCLKKRKLAIRGKPSSVSLIEGGYGI
jgi:hypothetical protein